MSPFAVATEPVVALRPFAAVAPDPTVPLAASSVETVVPRPLWLAIGATIVALLVGLVLLVAAARFTRTVGDDIAERPDLAFATGFVGLFGLLVAVSLPLIVSSAVEHAALAALAGLVSIPGLFLWGIVLVVGSSVGAVAVGARIADRHTDSRSLAPALVIGAAVLGASQLVPVLGALVAMGLATVAVGAIARRRFDVDDRLFDGDEGRAREPTARPTAGRSRIVREREPGRSSSAAARRPGDEPGGRTTMRQRDASGPETKIATDWTDTDVDGPHRENRGWTTDDSGRDDIDLVGDDENWTVDGWEWDADLDREGDGGDDRDGDDRDDEPREESVDGR